MANDYYNDDRRAYVNLRKSASCAHKLDYHFVFATKYRKPVLEFSLAATLRDLILEICKERRILVLALSIQPDHVHLILGLRPDDCPAEVAHDLKGKSPFKMIGEFPDLKDALGSTKLWGAGYSVETLGKANVAQIDTYLQNQELHHLEREISAD